LGSDNTTPQHCNFKEYIVNGFERKKVQSSSLLRRECSLRLSMARCMHCTSLGSQVFLITCTTQSRDSSNNETSKCGLDLPWVSKGKSLLEYFKEPSSALHYTTRTVMTCHHRLKHTSLDITMVSTQH
jgi:hypothetical protein